MPAQVFGLDCISTSLHIEACAVIQCYTLILRAHRLKCLSCCCPRVTKLNLYKTLKGVLPLSMVPTAISSSHELGCSACSSVHIVSGSSSHILHVLLPGCIGGWRAYQPRMMRRRRRLQLSWQSCWARKGCHGCSWCTSSSSRRRSCKLNSRLF